MTNDNGEVQEVQEEHRDDKGKITSSLRIDTSSISRTFSNSIPSSPNTPRNSLSDYFSLTPGANTDSGNDDDNGNGESSRRNSGNM